MIDDQGALHLHPQLPQKWLAGIEIDVEDLKMREFRHGVEVLENWPLLRASGTPGRFDKNQDRLAALLRGFEGGLLVRLNGGGLRWAKCADGHCDAQTHESGQCLHGWDFPQKNSGVATLIRGD